MQGLICSSLSCMSASSFFSSSLSFCNSILFSRIHLGFHLGLGPFRWVRILWYHILPCIESLSPFRHFPFYPIFFSVYSESPLCLPPGQDSLLACFGV